MNGPGFPKDAFRIDTEGWRIAPLKSALAANDGGLWGADPTGLNDTIVLRSTDQTIDGKWSIDDPARRQLGAKEREKASLHEGDLLVTKSSGSDLHIGKTTLVTREIENDGCCFSNFMQRLRVNAHTIPKFIYWVLNSSFARSQMAFVSNSTSGLGNLNAGLLGSLQVLIPPIHEQAEIARFLDRETAESDALVRKYEQLIELLEEKRVALITQAVTKGLDSNVPMKDSGVDCIGETPATWDVTQIRRSWTVVDCKHVTVDFIEDGVPIVSVREVQGFDVDLTTAKRTTEQWYARMIDGNRQPRRVISSFVETCQWGHVHTSRLMNALLSAKMSAYFVRLSITRDT